MLTIIRQYLAFFALLILCRTKLTYLTQPSTRIPGNHANVPEWHGTPSTIAARNAYGRTA